MKKIAVIALRHPVMPNLFLHGLRRDNHKWALPGGHGKPGEADHESARRELEEETGLTDIQLDKVHDQKYGDAHIHLFHAESPLGTDLNPSDDPDGEFVTFKYLDPTTHENLHIPKERNILTEWMSGPLSNSVKKAAAKIKVEPFVVDKEMFNPKKHDFIVRAIHRGKAVGILAVTHKKAGIMPFNLSVDKLHRRKGFASAMASHAEKISGKKIVRSPDMTSDGVAFANRFIKGTVLKKDESPQPEEIVLEYPVTVGDQRASLIVKDFGQDSAVDPQQIVGLVDQFGFSEPINANKLMFHPRELQNIRGDKDHVLIISGLPSKISDVRNAAKDLGPDQRTWTPHVGIDESTYLKLKEIGPALTAGEIGIQFHPAELRSGATVLKTY